MTRAPVCCAAPRCRVHVAKGQWFCPDHWFSLSDRLRAALGATWRARHVAAFQELWTEALTVLDPMPRRTTAPTIAFEGEQPVVYASGRLL